jgi:alkylhydroperoxidase/carboxymuconolactone decarboxylase family protein YurZ
MDLRALLARPGLAEPTRVSIGAAVAIWRGEWHTLRDWLVAGQRLGQPRGDLEEVLLQAVLFCGFPRVVTAFEHFAAVWPAPAPPAGGALPAAEQAAAGRTLFATVYGANAPAVEAMLRSFHADFHAFVLEAAYGRVLARPHLPAKQRELIAVALLAVQDQPKQFAGHARGATNCGASRTELYEALVTAFGGEPESAPWRQRLR